LKQNNYLIRVFRVVRLALHLLKGVAVVLALFPWLSDTVRLRVEQRWHRSLLNVLNVRLRLHGDVPDLSVHNMFVVANHISWLDIYLLNAVRPVRFVSKADVRSWPIVGWLAYKTGTLFIDRTKRHDTARVNHQISSVLNHGGCVAIFPEGTTSDGSMLRPFHASLLQPVVHSQCKIWPVAIRYAHTDGSLNTAPAYVDELTFADSLLLILSQQVIYAEMVFRQPIHAHGKTRRELAREAELAIADALNLQIGHKAKPAEAWVPSELRTSLN
jgi:1-acyl-sn-glycerol-3-phosphate acyltransferase